MIAQFLSCAVLACCELLFLATLLPVTTVAEEWIAPPALKVIVAKGARNASTSLFDGEEAPQDEILAQWHYILLLTVADALYVPGGHSVDNLEAPTSEIELTRTDKRSGASSKSNASTTLVEKGGLPRLLSMALERGAAEGGFDGTNLTVTATPYSLMALITEDSQRNYEKFSTLSRLGLSASFAVGDDLRSNKDNLSEFSVILRVDGDRSTRSKEFNERWKYRVNPLMQSRINNLSGVASNVFHDATEFMLVADDVQDLILIETKTIMEINSALSIDELTQLLSEATLHQIRTRIYEPLVEGKIVLPDDKKEIIRSRVVTAFKEANKLLVQAQDEAAEIITELTSQRVVTLGFTQQRENNRPSLSEVRLVIDQPLAGNELYVNAFVTFNHNPVETLGEKSLHDYGGSISWERTLDNILTRDLVDADAIPITVSLDVRLSHLEEENFERFTTQLRLTIPLPNGLVLPSSFRFDSRGLDDGKPKFQVNFGLVFDIDKLVALSKL